MKQITIARVSRWQITPAGKLALEAVNDFVRVRSRCQRRRSEQVTSKQLSRMFIRNTL